MRITHYVHHVWLTDGGTCRAILDMCLWQARAGADVVLATCDPKDAPKEWLRGGPGLPTVRTLPPAGKVGFFLPAPLRAAFEDTLRKTDVLHMHSIWDP